LVVKDGGENGVVDTMSIGVGEIVHHHLESRVKENRKWASEMGNVRKRKE
jgi:hypothetical protein